MGDERRRGAPENSHGDGHGRGMDCFSRGELGVPRHLPESPDVSRVRLGSNMVSGSEFALRVALCDLVSVCCAHSFSLSYHHFRWRDSRGAKGCAGERLLLNVDEAEVCLGCVDIWKTVGMTWLVK